MDGEILKKLRLLLGALRKFYDDKRFFLSSGITFNLLMGLIPLTLLLLALAGTYLYSDRAVLSHLSQYRDRGVKSHRGLHRLSFNSKILLELKIITRNVETSKWRIENIDPTFVQL